jgi:cob(I)alamin adenosyltransferase
VSIVTGGGDQGETSLLYGGRVPKDDLRTEAYGALDEAISAMGLARALCARREVAEGLLELERECFTVGAELATDPQLRDRLEKHFPVLSREAPERLEEWVHRLEREIGIPGPLPGATG